VVLLLVDFINPLRCPDAEKLAPSAAAAAEGRFPRPVGALQPSRP
jgi:hypothetical protein